MPATAKEIVDYAVEAQENGNLSPETKNHAKELHERATKAVEEGDTDTQDLDFAMRVLQRLIQKTRDRDFVFGMGDWCATIVETVRCGLVF